MTSKLAPYPVIARGITAKAGFKKILREITLVLKAGEFVGLIGGSGSGKTTLLTCLNGFRSLSGGSVVLNGIAADSRREVRHLIGYVPQDDLVHRTLTVERALHYAYLLRVNADVPPDKVETAVGRILHHLDLEAHREKKIGSLSGGQRKRVNIGVELLHSPPLFFLDEPTAGLDPALERQLMKLLARIAKGGRLVVITTHLMQHVGLFDVLIFIHKGRMIYCGPSDAILPYFGSADMVELFEKVAAKDPDELQMRYRQSPVFLGFMEPRLEACAHVR